MAVEVQTRQIGEHRYRVTQLTGVKSRKLFVRLTKVLGPALASLVGSGSVRQLLGVSVSSLGPIVGELVEKITEEELEYFCETLGAVSELVNESGTGVRLDVKLQDLHFAGRTLDMFKWLAFALEVNYTDFLSAFKSIQAARSAPTTEASLSPTLSTGMSGAS